MTIVVKNKMLNLTEIIHQTTIEEFYCSTTLTEPKPKIIFSAINIFLSITAFVGNVLIIAVLPKVSSLHPPSKLLLGCLASTDLCVGLVVQPFYVNDLLSTEHSKHCYYSTLLFNTTSPFFCGVYLMTLTAISVDRLLALKLRIRYKQVVTLRKVWVLVVIIWLSNTATAVIVLYIPYSSAIFPIEVILCIIASSSCYMKIYRILRHQQAQVQQHVHQGQQNGGETPLNIARYRKTVSSALWVQMTLLACYLPFGVVMAILVIYKPALILALHAKLTLLFLNSTLKPFLYCWKMKEVKHAVMNTIRKLNCFSC